MQRVIPQQLHRQLRWHRLHHGLRHVVVVVDRPNNRNNNRNNGFPRTIMTLPDGSSSSSIFISAGYTLQTTTTTSTTTTTKFPVTTTTTATTTMVLVVAAAFFFNATTAQKPMVLLEKGPQQQRQRRRQQPVRFGPSVRWMTTQDYSRFTVANNNNNNNDNDDLDEERASCPVCQKFSRGPCGAVFRRWLECTDQYPGPHPDNPNEEWHLTQCLPYAKPLAQCLEQYQSYYNHNDDDDQQQQDDDSDEQQDLQQAWSKVIAQVEQEHQEADAAFPHGAKPCLRVRPATQTGMAAFATKNLILCYVRGSNNDDDKSVLLAAGGREDLWLDWKDGYGVLQFSYLSPPGLVVSRITAHALYYSNDDDDDEDNENVILYSHTELIPSDKNPP